ncbi:MAG: ABC transporter ATP-binding protein [Rhodobacteraceae bacterium]|nr:ABC transporter ATP-binding protein [Paracoccaceae bacterium]
MIELRNLTKTFPARRGCKVVIDNANIRFPTGRSVGLMGRNGSGKTTLLQIIAGVMDHDKGEVLTDGTISYPVGFAGSFHKDLTGAQNVRFVARVYGIETDELVRFVEDFVELGDNFHIPVRHYSAGMRSRLTFGVSMGIYFDTYLIDEVVSVGDAAFRKKSSLVFQDRMKRSSAIFVSHNLRNVRNLCDAGAVIEDGSLMYFDNLEEAITLHLDNMQRFGKESTKG